MVSRSQESDDSGWYTRMRFFHSDELYSTCHCSNLKSRLIVLFSTSSTWLDWMGLKKTNLQKCPPCGNECQNTCKKIANSEWLKMEDCKHWYWANEKHGFQQSKHELEICTELVPSHWNYLHSNQTKFHLRSWQHFHSTSNGYQSKDARNLWTKREKHKHPSSNQNFSISKKYPWISYTCLDTQDTRKRRKEK